MIIPSVTGLLSAQQWCPSRNDHRCPHPVQPSTARRHPLVAACSPPEHDGVTALLPALITALPLAGAGLLAGVVARRLLARLRRGAQVPPPWCELGVGTAWGATGAAAGAGAVPAAWVPALLGAGVARGGGRGRRRAAPPAARRADPAGGAGRAGAPAAARDRRGARGVAGAAVAVGCVRRRPRRRPRAMGAGDVKLAGPLGAVLAAAGWPARCSPRWRRRCSPVGRAPWLLSRVGRGGGRSARAVDAARGWLVA